MEPEFELSLKPLVDIPLKSHVHRYQTISDWRDYETGHTCVLVRALHPDYFLLFSSIEVMITEHGSPLSHLAILALEYGIPVLRTQKPFKDIPQKGRLLIQENKMSLLPNR